jgi:hypothetical protein
MLDFPVDPPIVLKDAPKPRRLRSFAEAYSYLDQAMRLGRPPAWRDLWRRFETVTSEEAGVELIGALRELLAMEDLLEPPELPLVTSEDGRTRSRGTRK